MTAKKTEENLEISDFDLNDKQIKFVHNLVKGMSQEKAYIDAGYGPETAPQNASRLIRNAKVKAYLEFCREQAFNGVMDKLLANAGGAVCQLVAAMAEDDPSSAKISAAKAILSEVNNFYSKHQLEKKFNRVEEKVDDAVSRLS